MASNPRLGSVLSDITGAVEVGFELGSSIRIAFHKDHLDRKVGGWRQGDRLGSCCNNVDLKRQAP